MADISRPIAAVVRPLRAARLQCAMTPRAPACRLQVDTTAALRVWGRVGYYWVIVAFMECINTLSSACLHVCVNSVEHQADDDVRIDLLGLTTYPLQ
jgi:hypothetical protein